ncbi:MAG: DNA polymerase III subunit gamma and tau [Propionibacteriaceae bacterium]|nr:DNA polymerase III subunit gamma and tau [Propionibacteriaceae bacterium]
MSDDQAIQAGTQPDPATRSQPPLALYRRYRPDVFSEVIGQEQVTEPLRRALANNRVNHAYLFSGPRGCGKTTSARILARALNCVQGPTPDPCGQCQSCLDLATGGPGSIDVIEIDAASHGGVDDARDLRERAFFAPVQSRYKVYIVDEAHMVTNQGFNALLKVVEEPPPHVVFIFATTAPEKVIGTIRSRTHHYPFRLVPPRVLSDYLATICQAEGVPVETGVLGLVVRAGGGSVRDSLSVLDQLLGSAGPDGVRYAQASALLGYTSDALLDDYVDALAAGDAHGVFATVDKVVEAGQDPRRFAEDLLRRLRDLVIVAGVDDAFSSGLIDVSEDQAERYRTQARGLGAGELTRSAEVLAAGLTAMRGTTAPRLQLELMCARMLLPGADVTDRGLHARLDRLERRLDMAPWSGASTAETSVASQGGARVSGGQASLTGAAAQAPLDESASGPRPDDGFVQDSGWRSGGVPAAGASQRPSGVDGPESGLRSDGLGGPETGSGSMTRSSGAEMAEVNSAGRLGTGQGTRSSSGETGGVNSVGTTVDRTGTWSGSSMARVGSEAATGSQSGGGQTVGPVSATSAQPPPPASGLALDVGEIRRHWPRVLEEVKQRRKFTWFAVQQAQVTDLIGHILWLTFNNPGAKLSFAGRGEDDVHQVIIDLLGADLVVRGRLESDPPPRAEAAATVAEPRSSTSPSAGTASDDRPVSAVSTPPGAGPTGESVASPVSTSPQAEPADGRVMSPTSAPSADKVQPSGSAASAVNAVLTGGTAVAETADSTPLADGGEPVASVDSPVPAPVTEPAVSQQFDDSPELDDTIVPFSSASQAAEALVTEVFQAELISSTENKPTQ